MRSTAKSKRVDKVRISVHNLSLPISISKSSAHLQPQILPSTHPFSIHFHLRPTIMATFTNFLCKPPSAAATSVTRSVHGASQTNPFHSHSSFPLLPTLKHSSSALKLDTTRLNLLTPKATTSSPTPPKDATKKEIDRVKKVHNIEEFESALKSAKNRLVVVEYASKQSYHSNKIYPFMVDLSRNCSDVDFILVMGDESEETRKICKRENVQNVPHFTFYKNMEKIHEEEAVGPDRLVGDVLYYGDNHSEVVQIHSGEDVKSLIDEHKVDHQLIVLDVGLKHCGPCVKVYPTVLKLSRQMKDSVVFARMNGDENESCMKFLKDMDVIQVPTFLFIKDGEIRGRYVGSGKGELIGEILRYQGVRVTY